MGLIKSGESRRLPKNYDRPLDIARIRVERFLLLHAAGEMPRIAQPATRLYS